MLTLKKIAVTGPLSSGKSTVCRILAEISKVYVVDTDAIVHHLYRDPEIREKIAEIYNKKFSYDNPVTPLSIDRQFVARQVFDHPQLLAEIEALLHPYVLKKIESEYAQVKHQAIYDFFVVEVPLLYEVGWEREFDAVILVRTGEPLCKARFKEKTGQTEKEYQKRAQRFLSIQEKMQKTPFIVDNDNSLTSLKKQLITIIDMIQGD